MYLLNRRYPRIGQSLRPGNWNQYSLGFRAGKPRINSEAVRHGIVGTIRLPHGSD
jgi:hypothetical protein